MKPKKIYWTVSLFLLLLSCIVSAFFIFLQILIGIHQIDEPAQAMNALPTTIRFERDTLQLGTIRYGEKRKVTFRFTNTGQTPLLLRDVRPSCGCTGAEWEKRPVAPGETGEIKITFDPNSLGHFLKNIDIVCNIDSGIMKLKLCGNVIE